ncbi:MAG: UDP-N-acetylglucosamine--N-acetylmuramyl-(pentapeptide) pyrophosphoryl-undecaprenol N-acetylglucosamine transferase [Spirochaetota bacterium]
MSVLAFTGGGSGGHVMPGIAIVQALQERGDHSLVWFGSRRGIERSIVSRMVPEVRYISVPTGKLRRYLSFRNIIDAVKLPAGILVSLWYLLRLRPELLFSKGGFVSVPPVIAAWMLRIPVITHDSDADPGLATRINARFARYVCVPYSQSVSNFSPRISQRVVVTGNPVRRDILAGDPQRAEYYLSGMPATSDPTGGTAATSETPGGGSTTSEPPDGGSESTRSTPGGLRERPVVFVLGGSIGSGAINSLIDNGLDRFCELATIVHHRGPGHPAPATHRHYYPAEFFSEEFPHILARASLVIARAGAGTVWELAASATPAILIPLGSGSSRGDQLRNAELYAAGGAAVVRSEESLTTDALIELVSSLLSDERRLHSMSAAAASFAASDAVDTIVGLIDSVRAEAVR